MIVMSERTSAFDCEQTFHLTIDNIRLWTKNSVRKLSSKYTYDWQM